MGQPDVSSISIEQDTAATLTVVGLSEEEVMASEDCAGEVRWDDGQSAPMLPNEPFRP
jgi:hypothetical protein